MCSNSILVIGLILIAKMVLNLKGSFLILCNLPAKMLRVPHWSPSPVTRKYKVAGIQPCLGKNSTSVGRTTGRILNSRVWSGNRSTGVTLKWDAVCLFSFAIGWLHLLHPLLPFEQCVPLKVYTYTILPLPKAWKSYSKMLWSRFSGLSCSEDFGSWSSESIWCLTNFLQEDFQTGRKQYFLSASTWGFSVWHLRWKSFWVHVLGTPLWLGGYFLWLVCNLQIKASYLRIMLFSHFEGCCKVAGSCWAI